ARLGDTAALNRFRDVLRPDRFDASPKAHAARLRAVEALGEIGDPAATELLAAALRDAKGDTRLAAAVALARAGDERAAQPLLTALTQEAAATQTELAALEDRGGDAAAEVRQRRRPIRQAAAAALIRSVGGKAFDLLAPLLADADAEVRAVVASA